MTPKQEAIKKAYGEHWETVKDYVNENGYINRDLYREIYGNLKSAGRNVVDMLARPKSLQGIEYNNGWIKIEKDSDLPEQGIRVLGFSEQWIDEDFNLEGIRECHVCGFNLENSDWNSAKWDNNGDCWDADWETKPTHWKKMDLITPIY